MNPGEVICPICNQRYFRTCTQFNCPKCKGKGFRFWFYLSDDGHKVNKNKFILNNIITISLNLNNFIYN